MNQIIDVFHWVHGIFFALFAVFHTWSWYRGGFWIPGYVHAIALGALTAGIAFTVSLPPPANPDPMVQFLFPFFFPALGLGATYAIAIFGGFVAMAHREKRRISMGESQISNSDFPSAIK